MVATGKRLGMVHQICLDNGFYKESWTMFLFLTGFWIRIRIFGSPWIRNRILNGIQSSCLVFPEVGTRWFFLKSIIDRSIDKFHGLISINQWFFSSQLFDNRQIDSSISTKKRWFDNGTQEQCDNIFQNRQLCTFHHLKQPILIRAHYSYINLSMRFMRQQIKFRNSFSEEL